VWLFADVNDSCVTTNDTHALLRKNVQERKAIVLMKDKMEEERRLIRAQNGTVTTSESPANCSCVLSKAVLNKTFTAYTPPKRILPKSSSEDLEILQKTMSKVDSIAPNVRTATIRPSGSAPSGHFMLQIHLMLNRLLLSCLHPLFLQDQLAKSLPHNLPIKLYYCYKQLIKLCVCRN